MTPRFTNRQKMQCVQRELGYRRFVYAKRVADGKMKQAKADEEIALMEEISAEYGAAAEQDDKAKRLL